MIPTVRGMSAVSALRRLATSRLAQSGSLPNTLLLRTLSTRILAPKALQLTATPVLGGPISPLSTVDFCAREYATATKTRKSTTTKKTTAKKKKPAAKKKKPAAKKQKPAAKKKKPAPKKKKTAAKKKPVAKKKPKKKVAKPKVTRPKMTKFPPKHGIHGFSVYVKENFQSVTGATAPEKMSRVAAQWRALSEGEKAAYHERAISESEIRKLNYDRAIRKLSPDEIAEENSKRRILRSKYKAKHAHPVRHPNEPKRPLNAYIRFVTAHRDPGASLKEATAEVAQRWKSLSDSEKKPYVDAWEADKARYQQELAEYKGRA